MSQAMQMDPIHCEPQAEESEPLLLDRWLDLVEERILFRLSQAVGEVPLGQPPPPLEPGPAAAGHFGRYAQAQGLAGEEILLVAMALAPQVRPDLFDRVVGSFGIEGNFELLGGLRGKHHRGVLPTGETALFALAGFDTRARLHWQAQLSGDSPAVRGGTLILALPEPGEPPMSGRLLVDTDAAEQMLTGQHRAPPMSEAFPARRIDTGLDWDALVLPAQTLQRIEELHAWMVHRDTILDDWGMRPKLRPGYRALFYGPPGTGKTLTATLLGKRLGCEVFRVDLSMIVSKFIGETEKNLAGLFDRAEHKNWILFFDEADALFGKRSQVRDARDRYANQEVSFLLQRIEVFSGLAILASNLTNNVDTAFSRRFEAMIHFPMPKAGERLALFRKALPEGIALTGGLDLAGIASRYEISGGTIINVVRHVCLAAVSRGETVLRQADFEEGIRREFAKENRLQ